MEVLRINEDIMVFGKQVPTFPAGINEAFDELIKKTGDCAGARNYYGLSKFKDGRMVYYALAEQKHAGEAEKYNYEKLAIDRGNYAGETVTSWQTKTGSIRDVFNKIIQDPRVDKTKPAIEWYKSDNEMMCMVQMQSTEKHL